MRYFARVVSVLLFILATFPLSYATPLYPEAPPPGEATGGVFDTYFTNMYTAPCAIGQVIEGFTSTGVLICTPVSTSLDTLAFSGSLIGTEGYIPRYTVSGTGITTSQIYDSGTGIGIGTVTPLAILDVRGDIRVNGISIGRGAGDLSLNTILGYQTFVANIAGTYNTAVGAYALTNDITGTYNTALGYSAGSNINMGANNTLIGSSAGANITSGNNNIAIGATTNMVSATASNQLNIGNWIYGSGGNIGIGITTPLTRLHISSGSGGVSGVRLHDLVATSPIYGGLATPIGVDGSGNIVNTVAGNIPVYTGLGASTSSPVNNSTNPPTIGADYNKYFTLPVRQSFVVTDVGGQPANAPNFAVNGATNKCSGGGCQTPWATYMMSAQNSITASSRYAYQIMISDRVDAPFVVRGGTYYNSTQDIMNTAGTVSALWFKALTVPTNHSEYFYVNPGVDQNNNPISGGGNVGLGTAYPDLQFVVAETTATNRIMQVKRGTQGSDSSMVTGYGTPYINIGGLENRVNSIQTIAFGYSSLSGAVRYAPAEIGFLTTSVAGNTQGDIVFANRTSTTNVAPTEVVRITSTGAVGIGTATPVAKFDVAGTTRLGTAGTVITTAGVCTIGSTAISTTATSYACTGIPASTSVAVSCTAGAAFTTPGTTALYCRAGGVANSVVCNTTVANAVSTTYKCMWMQ